MIDGFAKLRIEDQKDIRENLGESNNLSPLSLIFNWNKSIVSHHTLLCEVILLWHC